MNLLIKMCSEYRLKFCLLSEHYFEISRRYNQIWFSLIYLQFWHQKSIALLFCNGDKFWRKVRREKRMGNLGNCVRWPDSWDVDDRLDQEYRVKLMSFAREIEINIKFSYEVFFLEIIELLFCEIKSMTQLQLIVLLRLLFFFREIFFILCICKNNLMWHREEIEKVIGYTIEINGTATR